MTDREQAADERPAEDETVSTSGRPNAEGATATAIELDTIETGAGKPEAAVSRAPAARGASETGETAADDAGPDEIAADEAGSDTAEANAEAADTDETGTDDADTSALDAGAGSVATPAGRVPPRRRLVPAVLVALVVVSSVAVGVLGWRVYSNARDQQAQREALAAARDETAQVLSYSARTLDTDLAHSRTVIAGSFAARFEDLVNTVIIPAARQRNLATRATVTRAAVIDAPPGQLHALLFVNQVTGMDGQPGPHQVTNQVRVTMTRADGRWLISDLQPL